MPKQPSLFLLLLLTCCGIRSQSYIGLREITNFSKQDYNGGAQSWNILQDRNGTMYFANNEGLLRFDGVYWHLFPLDNKTIVRSMELGNDHRIYVGGQDEIGYFSPNQSGRLSYTSLRNLIAPDQQKFADIWDITIINDEIFFRASQKIFRYSQGKITVYAPGGYWLFMGTMAGKVVAQHDRLGLVTFYNGNWQPAFSTGQLPAGYFRKMVDFGQDSTLAIGSSGSYIITQNRIVPFVINGLASDNNLQYSDIIAMDQDHLLLGTYSSGFYLVDKSGNIIEHFSQKEGLQNSNVRCLFRDRGGNLWLGLDSGIDFIAFNSSVKQINPAIFNGGAGYGVAQNHEKLYFAMSNGLFSLPLPNLRDLSFAPDKFRQVSGGQTWTVAVLKDMVLAGRDEGFYTVEDDHAVRVARNPGYWTFQHQQQGERSMIVAGNYEGISFFENQGQQVIASGKVADFHESARFIVIDNNDDIWMSHPYRGVYKIKGSNGNASSIKLFTQEDGLPSSLNNHVYRIKNRVVVATEKGIYEYSQENQRFAPSPYFREIFGELSIRYLKEDLSGNIWFVQEKNIGVVDFSRLKPTIIYFPELQGRILSGFESIYPLNDNNVFVGGEKGFYHINFEKYRENNQPLDVFIRQVSASGRTDSIIFGGYGPDVNAAIGQSGSQDPSLSPQNSSVHFEYSSPLYDQAVNLEYSYILQGFDKTWSQWSKKAEKDYTSLPPGDYVFRVKVRNNLMGESRPASYSFVVLHPWYRSTWAMFLYVSLGVWIVYLLYRKQKKNLLRERTRHQEEQRKLAYLHQLELEKSEKELVKLKNDKLETEIEFKNSELATTAMHLVQKGELLVKIKDELQHLTRAAKDKTGATDVKKLIRILNEEDKLQEEWEQFSVHFDKVHSDYLVTLKNKYPGLSAHELKLCAYLRMNLSSKEIAQLMSISVRGVEISRYRLRKKLAIPTETNLFQFLFDIQKNNLNS